MTTKTRAELKSYFITNAIPNEGQFADLIDSQFNLRDDNPIKGSGEAFGLVAVQTEQKPVLRLYADYPKDKPDWLMVLNPRDPADRTKTGGFGIVDGAGDTKLRLDAAGNLHISGERIVAGGKQVALVPDLIRIDFGSCHFTTIPNDDVLLDRASWRTSQMMPEDERQRRLNMNDQTVRFKVAFNQRPSVVIGINVIEASAWPMRIAARATNISSEAVTFSLHVSRDGATIESAEIFWLAFGT